MSVLILKGGLVPVARGVSIQDAGTSTFHSTSTQVVAYTKNEWFSV
jgi:hypothetical protein